MSLPPSPKFGFPPAAVPLHLWVCGDVVVASDMDLSWRVAKAGCYLLPPTLLSPFAPLCV